MLEPHAFGRRKGRLHMRIRFEALIDEVELERPGCNRRDGACHATHLLWGKVACGEYEHQTVAIRPIEISHTHSTHSACNALIVCSLGIGNIHSAVCMLRAYTSQIFLYSGVASL